MASTTAVRTRPIHTVSDEGRRPLPPLMLPSPDPEPCISTGIPPVGSPPPGTGTVCDPVGSTTIPVGPIEKTGGLEAAVVVAAVITETVVGVSVDVVVGAAVVVAIVVAAVVVRLVVVVAGTGAEVASTGWQASTSDPDPLLSSSSSVVVLVGPSTTMPLRS